MPQLVANVLAQLQAAFTHPYSGSRSAVERMRAEAEAMLRERQAQVADSCTAHWPFLLRR